MLFKEIEGMEIIDKNGERVGFVHDIVFTTTGRITHLIAMPKGIISKVTMGQLNLQFEMLTLLRKLQTLLRCRYFLRQVLLPWHRQMQVLRMF